MSNYLGPKYQVSSNANPRAAVGTTPDVAKNHAHAIGKDRLGTGKLQGTLNLISVQVSSIVTATQLTVLACADAAGDVPLCPMTTVDIDTGLTTTTKGMAHIKVDAPMWLQEDSTTLYLFFATDAGTVTVDKSQIVWSKI